MVLVLLLSVISCSNGSVQLPTVQVQFKHRDGTVTPPFSVEVAATEAQRRKGLMYRREMAEDHGMLFLFTEEEVQSFWMKNTILSLDMVFVSKDWEIVGILDRVPPQNEAPRKVDGVSQFVIEFGGGVMKKFGVEAGDKVLVDGTLPMAE
jgi:uncharacterized membrane protein (UPF0127 family)